MNIQTTLRNQIVIYSGIEITIIDDVVYMPIDIVIHPPRGHRQPRQKIQTARHQNKISLKKEDSSFLKKRSKKLLPIAFGTKTSA
jgi:hypothetical protein